MADYSVGSSGFGDAFRARNTNWDEEAKKRLAEAGRGFLHGMNPARTTVAPEREQVAGRPSVSMNENVTGSGVASGPVSGQEVDPPAAGFHPGDVKPMVNRPQSVAAPPAQAAPRPFKSTLPGGITYTADQQGNRTYTMGTPGQDGYGMVRVNNPSNDPNWMERQRVAGQQQQQPSLGMVRRTGNGFQVQGANGPYSFQGSAADAARFGAPVSRPAPTVATQAASEPLMYRQIRDDRGGGSEVEVPKYLGPESGLGWQTRMKKYEAELDAYNKATGNRAQMDIEAMRQAGAGRQSLLQAQGISERNAIDRQRLGMEAPGMELDQQNKQIELGFNKQKSDIVGKLNAAKDPNERRALYSQLLAMQGKDPAQKYQIVTREEVDPGTGQITKTPMVINQDDPTQAFEVRGQGAGQEEVAQAPPAAIEFLKKNPKQAGAFKQKYGYLPPGF